MPGNSSLLKPRRRAYPCIVRLADASPLIGFEDREKHTQRNVRLPVTNRDCVSSSTVSSCTIAEGETP